MSEEIIYQNKDGYFGKLYGKSSMILMHESGSPYLHTGSRSINTLEELKELVDDFPNFIKKLKGAKFDDDEDI